MDRNDGDVEVFERIPWDSLEKSPDRRWMAYALAGMVVLGAVGYSIGRSMPPSPGPVEPSPVETSDLAPTTATGSLPPDTASGLSPDPTVLAAPEPSTTWSEADLMALPSTDLESSASALAEWFVVDHFTREGEGGRSFVDWAGAWERSWVDETTLSVVVLLHRLAAAEGDDYRRLPPEGWAVTARLDDDGWAIIGPPRRVETPEMAAEIGAVEGEEWVDEAGLSWEVASPEEGS